MANDNDPGFDDTLTALKRVVDELEGGQLSLERSLASFEEGVKLARRGAQILDSAERRVEVLLKGEAGSGPTIAPFADGSND